MGTRLHTHFMPYTPEQLFDLVADIEKYPEFLPWCAAARILSKSETEIVADLSVGYKLFRETFRSRVHLTPKTRIDVEYITGPFQSLNNHWIFKQAPSFGTNVDFFIEFQFRNRLFQSATQKVFEGAFNQMLSSFEKRAQQLYGVK
ncbi:MAG: type II toxin-antitoxin system RatA family toxin [Alphaproteobacteria bacterium]|nr:type II toxin-antitoxin system RatA family toxin [Alphaproteobacteria bacterium]